ncbi:MAG: LysM peptidoglycan-binding domain-containing protein [Flavobacteriaceae bacterium]|nr:LysM peptidoglycan-binding domain-containing protein [Flavobacteriaceae bacterium]
MKKFLIALSFVLAFCSSALAQNYKTHKVKVGETIEDIAKKYMVTPFDIFALNPDAKTSLQPNAVLIIPESKFLENPVEVEEVQLVGYTSHKVKRKETLYGIAQLYNISVDELKKHNTRLYSENLRKGDKLQIPKYSKVKTTSKLANTIKKYKVLPKEGKWRIAYKFGISVPELEALNPKMSGDLQAGQEINVPNIASNEEKTVEENYSYYTVLKSEGYMTLNRKLGVTQDQLEQLNPELKEGGLKLGMILKVPLDATTNIDLEDVNKTTLAKEITNFNKKRLAVMIPFRLKSIDFDSLSGVKKSVKNDRLLAISLDFHSGVLMALDSAKQLGISTKLDVYDTEASASKLSSIISDNDFSEYDAVIGPFRAKDFDRAANMLKRDNVPMISPLTIPENLYDNVFQTIPSDDLLLKKIVNFVKQDSTPKNIVIISDESHRAISNTLRSELGNAKLIFSRKNKDGKEGFFILGDDVQPFLKEGRNYVFLETNNEGFISNVSSMLKSLNGISIEGTKERPIEVEREIMLLTTKKEDAFEGENISNFDLSNLKFHYPSYNLDYDSERSNSFVKRYKSVYGGLPSRYATRGFDLTMDVLLRLSSADNLYKGADSSIETQYVENKFRYSKKLFGGYYNEAVFIVKYDDLKIVEVKQ